ncbi:hypothetical protein AB1E18_018302 [Capra hircus]
MRPAKAPRVTSCYAYLCLPPSALQPGACGFHVSLNTWDKLSFPFCYRYFSSHVTRGRPPPAAEVTGKLPPFDPCGPWVAGDRLRPLFPSLGCVLALGALLRYSLRRGSSYPVFQQNSNTKLAFAAVSGLPSWWCFPPGEAAVYQKGTFVPFASDAACLHVLEFYYSKNKCHLFD